jgi:uncharacterized delta-60 repeat protein
MVQLEMSDMKCRISKWFFICFVVIISSSYFVCDSASLTLDPTFGNDGRVAVELGVNGDRANAVVVQADGNIVVAGSSSNAADLDFMLFRLQPDGSLDPTFNFDGTVITPVGYFDDEILAVTLQDDGKIIAVGYSSNGNNRDFAMVRYNSDGSLDRNFGLEGMVVTAVGNSHDEITGVALQADGSIVVTGSAMGTAGRVVALARYFADGSLDTGFGDDGFALIGVGQDAQAESVVLLADQRIIVSGSYSEDDKTGLMLVGLTSAGRLDKNFADNGVAVPADGSVFTEGYGMFVRRDGKILVAGSVGREGSRDAALFQFTATGIPDLSFENNGVLVTAVSNGDDVLYDVIETGNMIAASGFKTVEGGREFLFITYENSRVTVQQPAADANPTIKIGELQYEESLTEYRETEEPDKLVVDVMSTAFDDGEDISTALAALSLNSVVVVGESAGTDTTIAAVSKYNTSIMTSAITSSTTSTGSEYILTGEPYDVTRTTAIIPVEILSGLGVISKRGVVFSTMPNPILKEDDSSDGGDGTKDAPTRTNLSPSGTVTTSAVTMSLTTDVSATCRYTDSGAGMDYNEMTSAFDTTGGTSHSESLTVEDGKTYSFWIKCNNDSTGVANSTDSVISFTVELSTTQPPAPVLSNLEPSGTVTLTSASLSLTTDVRASCRYMESVPGTDYNQMTGRFDSIEGRSHLEQVTDLADGEEYTYYVRCMNISTGEENTSDSEIAFFVKLSEKGDGTPPVITNATPPDYSFGDESITLVVTTDVAAECRYSRDNDDDYAAMNGSFQAGADSLRHTAPIGAQPMGENVYYARCEDGDGNSNTTGEQIVFTVEEIAPPGTDTDTAPAATLLPLNSGSLTMGLHSTMQTVGNFLVAPVMAADDTGGDTPTDDTADEDFLEEGYTSEGSGTGIFSTKPKNLKPGTFFYVRAYVVVGSTVYYGNQVGFRTADSCFVATAAFGSIFHPYVRILRDFRDRFMFDNQFSRSLITLYYHFSPPVADIIASNTELRFLTRVVLLPIVGAAWLAMQLGLLGLLLPVGVLLFCWLAMRPAAISRASVEEMDFTG